MPSTEGEMEECFPFLVAMITMLVLILFFPLIQERFHWILLVGVTFWVLQSDVNNGFRLTLP